jgi:hypothetical protein
VAVQLGHSCCEEQPSNGDIEEYDRNDHSDDSPCPPRKREFSEKVSKECWSWRNREIKSFEANQHPEKIKHHFDGLDIRFISWTTQETFKNQIEKETSNDKKR